MAGEKDIVLIYFEDQPLSYARIEEILPDSKPNWYHVRLLLLQFPLQPAQTPSEPEDKKTVRKQPLEGKVISLKDLKKS